MTLEDCKFLLAKVRSPLVRVSPAGGRASEGGGHWGRARLMGINGVTALIQPMGHKKIEHVDPAYLNNWLSKNEVVVPSDEKQAPAVDPWERADQLWNAGKPMRKIAEAVNIPSPTLSKYFTKKGMRRNKKPTPVVVPVVVPEAVPMVFVARPEWVAPKPSHSSDNDLKAALQMILKMKIADTSKLLAIEALTM